MNQINTSLFRSLLTLTIVGAASAQFTPIDLSPWTNARIQNYQPSAASYPEGSVVLGNVPFEIRTVGGNNAWNAEMVSGPQPHVLNVPIGACGATTIFTLINTFYGRPGPASYITLEFYGSSGGYHRKDLIGNVDVRDHFYAGNTNAINNTTTINVFSTGGGPYSENRLDMQRITLPPAFASQTLTSMRLTSTGGVGISDATIQGLTIQSICGTGQTNSPCAALVINGVGTNGQGPFLLQAPAGTNLNLTWTGPANQPLALLAAPTLVPGQNLGNGLIIDLELSGLVTMFSGLDPIGGLLFATNAAQGTHGTGNQTFGIPMRAAGGILNVQGVVFDLTNVCPGPGYMTTASFAIRM